jgi:hypothetical protein
MKRTIVILVVAVFAFSSCKSEGTKNKEQASEVIVFNLADDNAKKEFGALKLDETHQNMLNPTFSKESHEVAMKSWSDIHYGLNDFLKKEQFDWGIDSERIKIFNKIYFQKDGQVKYYVYGIQTDVSAEKKEAFGKLAQQFFAQEKISLTRDADFAQCGKASLLNTNI